MPPRSEHPLTQAILEQLLAEMAATGFSVASLARAIDTDRNTLRRWMQGEREMPVTVFAAILEAIAIDPAVFMARARDRLADPPVGE